MDVLTLVLVLIGLLLLGLVFLGLRHVGVIGERGIHRVAWGGGGVCLLLLAYHLADVLNPVLVALLLAYALDPIVSGAEKRGWNRKVVVTGLTVGVFVVVAGLLAYAATSTVSSYEAISFNLFGGVYRDVDGDGARDDWEPIISGELPEGTPVRDEGARGDGDAIEVEGVPGEVEEEETAEEEGPLLRHAGIVDKVRSRAEGARRRVDPSTTAWLREKLEASAESIITGVMEGLGYVWTGIVSPLYHLLLTYLVLVPFYLFFFLLKFDDMVRAVRDHLPGRHRPRIVRIVGEIDEATADFFRTRTLIALGEAVVYGVGFTIAGVPMAPVIGIVSGALSFVPIVGTVVAFLLGSALVWTAPGWGPFLWVLGTVVLVDLLENVLSPFLYRGEHSLHPVTYIVSMFVAGKLLGFFGVLLAVPLACIVKILGKEFILPEIRELAAHPPAPDPGAPDGTSAAEE